MRRCFLAFLFLQLSFGFTHAQQPAADSLKWYLAQVDSIKVTEADRAFVYATRALVLARKRQAIPMQVKALFKMGEIRQNQSRFKESVGYFLRAIRLGEQHHLSVASPMNGLGISYYYLNDLPKSEYYIRKAANAKKQEGDYVQYASALTNLAGTYFSRGDYETALRTLRGVEQTLIRAKEYPSLCNLYNGMGSIQQLGKNNLDSAAYYFRRSLDLAIRHRLPDSQLSAYHNLGEVQHLQGNNEAALENLHASLKLSEELDRDAMRINIYRTLGEVYTSMRNYPEALKYKDLQIVTSDSVFQLDKQKAIEELEIRYKTARNEQQLQEQQVRLEQAKNTQTLLIFTSALVFVVMAGIAFYFYQRRKTQRRFEQEKSKLFENIVHDIRTPLSLITGPLQELRRQLPEEQHARHIALIGHNSEKLVTLVNELLDASKLEKGKYQLSWHTGGLRGYIEQQLEGFRQQAAARRTEILFPSGEGTDSAVVFPVNAVEKIVANLVGNALKYSPEGSTVTVGFSLSENTATLSVSDNGPGIARQHTDRIFDRFYRVEGTETIPGTGIGLSLVKELTGLMQGTISLDSEPGRGTTVTVSFPVSQPSVLPAVPEDDQRMSVLIVEDDLELADFVGSLLREDYHVVIARNGDEGLRTATHMLPDLVLSDVMMPVKDGIQLLQEIKGSELTNHIPVVLFSAKSALESRMLGLRHGADAYVPKPFNTGELQLTIRNLILTSQRNREQYGQVLRREVPFDERVRSPHAYVNQVIGLIVAQLDNADYSVNELAADLHISRSQLHRKLQALTGFSTTNFIRMVRLEKARDLLRAGYGNVTEVAYACGFNSQSYFTKSFTEYFGEAPSRLTD